MSEDEFYKMMIIIFAIIWIIIWTIFTYNNWNDKELSAMGIVFGYLFGGLLVSLLWPGVVMGAILYLPIYIIKKLRGH